MHILEHYVRDESGTTEEQRRFYASRHPELRANKARACIRSLQRPRQRRDHPQEFSGHGCGVVWLSLIFFKSNNLDYNNPDL